VKTEEEVIVENKEIIFYSTVVLLRRTTREIINTELISFPHNEIIFQLLSLQFAEKESQENCFR